MTPLTTSAPGKLVLSGEYAVLDGAPAIVMAVNRRASVTVSALEDDCHVIDSVGHDPGRFKSDGGKLQFVAGERSHRLFAAVWNTVAPTPTGSRIFKLDTNSFVDPDSGKKLGIGSSAALTVALCAALVGSSADRETIVEVAMRAHRHFQGGVGSGVDIASSISGGMIEYRIDQTVATRSAWPDGVCYALLWSGVPANSKDKLKQLDRQTRKFSCTVLGDSAERVANAWRLNDSHVLIDEYANYIEALRRFDSDYELGIFDAGHDQLRDAAIRQSLVYKPCGAGGGDVGVVLGTDAAKLAAFTRNATRLGFQTLDMAIDCRGVDRQGGES